MFLENSHGGWWIIFVHNRFIPVYSEKISILNLKYWQFSNIFSCCYKVKYQYKGHIISLQFIFMYQLTSWRILPFLLLLFFSHIHDLDIIFHHVSREMQRGNNIQSNQFVHFLTCLVKDWIGMEFEVTGQNWRFGIICILFGSLFPFYLCWFLT